MLMSRSFAFLFLSPAGACIASQEAHITFQQNPCQKICHFIIENAIFSHQTFSNGNCFYSVFLILF